MPCDVNDARRVRGLAYHPDAYDEHFALRVPAVLWLVMAWAVHPLILLALGHLPQSGNEFAYVARLVEAPALLATLPAVVVLVAAARRRPAAGVLTRGTWRHGRWLLLIALVANFSLCLPHPHGAWLALRMGADVAAASALLTVARVRDTFADFPVDERA